MLIGTKYNGYRNGIRIYYKGGGGPSAEEVAAANARAQEQLAAQERARIQANQARIDGAFAPIDDAFYDARKQSYVDFYRPSYQDQQKAAHDQLVASLATRGLLGSSQDAKEQADFQKKADDVWANILSNADSYVMGLRGQVGSSKQSVMGMASSADTAMLDRLAGEQVQMATRAPTFSPVGQLFANMSTPAAMGVASQGANYLPSSTNIAGTPQIGGKSKLGYAVG